MLYKYQRLSEVNIQAECYHRLRLLNIPCVLEYKATNSNERNCRLDMIILKEDSIIAIVEFKNKVFNECKPAITGKK